MSLPLDWVKHLKDPTKREEYIQTLRASQTIIERLTTLLEEYEIAIDKTETSLVEYDSPSWAYKQAHRNGQRSTLKYLSDLLRPLKG
jgi:hypothetical protein